MIRRGHIELFRDDNKEWRWRRVAENGKILASGEGYSRKIDALHVVHMDYPGMEVREVKNKSAPPKRLDDDYEGDRADEG
jgi:uncharacterized protein YegP (UPF0339 family)